MPLKYIDKDTGKEQTVYSQDELDAKFKEAQEEAKKEIEALEKKAREQAVEEYKRSNPDKTDEINTLRKELHEAKSALDDAIAGGDNKGQIERLRRERDEALSKFDKIVQDVDKKIQDGINKVTSSINNDTKAALLKQFNPEGDSEIEKKLLYEFDRYNSDDNTKAGIEKRMNVAAQIIGIDTSKPGVLDNATGSGRGDRNIENTAGKPTENESKIGKMLGVTPEEIEKYKKDKGN